MFILVPAFSVGKSLANLQSWRNAAFFIMITFSCATYTATLIAKTYLSERADVVSCIGAIAIGSLSALYSRVLRGNAFTSAVTGVLFLVPVGTKNSL
jgi:uncharacterized membrane protein YjjB (DUF3815 family)